MTKSLRLFFLGLAFLGASATGGLAWAHEGHAMAGMSNKMPSGQLVPVTEKDAAWLAKAKAEYPTKMCMVSGDKLGADMGKPVDYIYREEGKPDRLISFCCKDCVKDFNKNPEKYLKALDEAGAKAADGAHAQHHG